MNYNCDRCGRPGANIIDEDRILCTDCYGLYNTCTTCQFGGKCEFNTNAAPIPKYVTQRQVQKTQMGIMEQIIQVPNPQRIKAFCIEGECECLEKDENGKYRCMGQFNICKKYKQIKL